MTRSGSGKGREPTSPEGVVSPQGRPDGDGEGLGGASACVCLHRCGSKGLCVCACVCARLCERVCVCVVWCECVWVCVVWCVWVCVGVCSEVCVSVCVAVGARVLLQQLRGWMDCTHVYPGRSPAARIALQGRQDRHMGLGGWGAVTLGWGGTVTRAGGVGDSHTWLGGAGGQHRAGGGGGQSHRARKGRAARDNPSPQSPVCPAGRRWGWVQGTHGEAREALGAVSGGAVFTLGSRRVRSSWDSPRPGATGPQGPRQPPPPGPCPGARVTHPFPHQPGVSGGSCRPWGSLGTLRRRRRSGPRRPATRAPRPLGGKEEGDFGGMTSWPSTELTRRT